MKKFILFSILFIGLHHDLFSQEESGIRFFSGTWKDVIAEAKKKKLPIFVDVYTDWCAPCKRMEREVFILPKVGKFFNSNFLCYRLNAEKAEGPELSKIFGFNAFPTWLYLNSEGILMSRNTDYMNADRFITFAQEALERGLVARKLVEFDKRFKKGERDQSFLKVYLEHRSKLQLDNAEILNAYVHNFPLDKEISKEELFFLIRTLGKLGRTPARLCLKN